MKSMLQSSKVAEDTAGARDRGDAGRHPACNAMIWRGLNLKPFVIRCPDCERRYSTFAELELHWRKAWNGNFHQEPSKHPKPGLSDNSV